MNSITMTLTLAILWIGCAGICAIVAPSKGRSALAWGLLGLCFGFFAVITLAMLPAAPESPRSTWSPQTHRPWQPDPELPPLRLGKSDPEPGDDKLATIFRPLPDDEPEVGKRRTKGGFSGKPGWPGDKV